MRIKNVLFSLVLLCVSAIVPATSSAAPLKVGMVTDVGGVNDQSFNQSAWEGLTKVKKELGIKTSYQESKQDADYPANLETLLDAKNDLIWGIGFKMADAILIAAKQNPKQKYAIIDYSFGAKTPKNVVGVMFKAEEGAFLAGYIAAKMSKTGTLGFIGGMSVPIIHSFQYGFKAGAKYANKKINILEQHAESFTDAAKGKAIANQMIGKGADVIFHAAGAVGDGVIEAVKEKDKMAVGVDRDQNYLAPKNVITSSMKRVDNAVFNVVSDLSKGVFKGGTTVEYGLKDGAVDIAPTTTKMIPSILLEDVAKIKKEIIAGKIKIPSTSSAYAAYIKTVK
ncbi:BMP family ABC transporter substrate-binding protein [Bacteriovorax sp. PP10]|uniref:BMP family ABC transporter substrate-binding protein n=1 Tax=Bacteriovorax antarcticus TaxID=3088717 RepID=A0ABU5VTJ0_9BACT|nr:BMP family ABC transporter substrate-binding protein [Bacteriovorax sp. PP10]MEA9355679.1 BMP family ABC transporter substrate-binding protein [Bacteriovorax sp. PP10]